MKLALIVTSNTFEVSYEATDTIYLWPIWNTFLGKSFQNVTSWFSTHMCSRSRVSRKLECQLWSSNWLTFIKEYIRYDIQLKIIPTNLKGLLNWFVTGNNKEEKVEGTENLVFHRRYRRVCWKRYSTVYDIQDLGSSVCHSIHENYWSGKVTRLSRIPPHLIVPHLVNCESFQKTVAR